jgi:hypothetical protein
MPITGYIIEMNDGSSSPPGRSLLSTPLTGVWKEVYDGRGNPTVTTVTITDLEPGVMYNFRMMQLQENGPSDYSTVSSFYS